MSLISIGKVGRPDIDRVRVGIVLKHDVSDEARDDHGRFFSGGGSSDVKSAPLNLDSAKFRDAYLKSKKQAADKKPAK